ncbi:hypothetical protein [Micromonospora chalcea]|uniref:hypothetical protein n=1 Tax=Micromonospora chalcea TaxID=1874 RepID=UPI003CF8B3D4
MGATQTNVVFVHGVGPPRRIDDELRQWTTALADGARSAGHSAFADALLRGKVPTSFAHYGDLFLPAQAQGGDLKLDEDQAELLAALLTELIDEQLAVTDEPERQQVLEAARSQLVPAGAEQGLLAPVRRAINAATTLLAFRPFIWAGQWLGGKLLVRDLAQVARYLARREPDEWRRTLDVRIRQRVHYRLTKRSVLIAHSLGSVVGWETLHEHNGEVPLLVTLGSPLAMRSVVWPHLVPQPPATPPVVEKWINLWDRDDIIVARAKLEADMRPNGLGVIPETSRIDSDGIWVHTATKYLRKAELAGPVAEAVRA